MKILVLIPAYNEENNLKEVIVKVKKALNKIDILVVNDGSTDKTEKIAKDSGVLVLSHAFNLGCGVALQTGYKYALEEKYDYLIQLDADGQHDPESIHSLLELILSTKTDIVIGSRFLNDTYKTDFIRRTGMIIFSFLVSKLIGQKLTDATSGFRVFNRNLIKFFSGEVFPTDFPDADLILATHLAGFKITEAPVKMFPSPPNKKPMHYGLTPVYYVFKMFLSLSITLIRGGEK